jgi:hypothetical protein
MREGCGIKDTVAPMYHMVIQGQHHERRIGDNTAEDARVHGVKIRGFGMPRAPQAIQCFSRRECTRSRHLGHGSQPCPSRGQPTLLLKIGWHELRDGRRFFKRKSAIQFRFRQDGMRNTFFDKLRSLLRRCGAVDGSFVGFTVVDLARFLGKARAHILEFFFDVVMQAN